MKADVRGNTVTSLLVATDAFPPIQHAPAVMHFIDEVLGLHDEVIGMSPRPFGTLEAFRLVCPSNFAIQFEHDPDGSTLREGFHLL